jgi:hypothetical protein
MARFRRLGSLASWIARSRAPVDSGSAILRGTRTSGEVAAAATWEAMVVMSFQGRRLAQLQLPVGTVWLLTGIAEAKDAEIGMELWSEQAELAMRDLGA